METIDKKLDRIEDILIGNGKEGLTSKVARLSVKVGIGTTLVTIIVTGIIAAFIRHML